MNIPEEKIQLFFENTVLEPKGSTIERSYARSAVNAVAIVTLKAWEDIVKSLVEQSHIKGFLPGEKGCISDMLRANGFKPVKLEYNQNDSFGCLVNTYDHRKRSFIVKLIMGGYYALVYDETLGSYVLKGYMTERRMTCNRRIDGLWEYIPDTDNRTGIKRSFNKKKSPDEFREFFPKNMNPEGRNTGDCVIRALSAVYECTWHEAIDHIAAATNYTEPMLNCIPSIITSLIALGFERHNELVRNGQLLNGKQFCEYMSHTYSKGERIFAFVGKHHCAAVLPFEENGRTVYKIQDTWDSTSKKIYEYWVYRDPKRAEEYTLKEVGEYAPGAEVRHPIFGNGVVISAFEGDDDRILEVKFQSGICKKIAESWFKRMSNKK